MFESPDFNFIISVARSVHIVSAIVGIVSALCADFLFFRALKDYKISQLELKRMQLCSKVIWAALASIVFTGVVLLLSDIAWYIASAKFLAKMSIVGVIIANGFLLNKYISPHLSSMQFGSRKSSMRRKMAFALGAVSITSWVSVFTIATRESILFPYAAIMVMYASVLCMAIIFSQVFEWALSARKIHIPF